MGKFIQTSMEDMREPLLASGTYPLVIEDCSLSDKLGWGPANPNAQKFHWLFSVEAMDEMPDVEGKTIRETTPDGPGISKQLFKYINGLRTTVEDFDPSEVIGTRVLGSVGQGTSYGEPCNKVWDIVLNEA